jgi:hypothetical protein
MCYRSEVRKMDIKGASEAVGLLGSVKELKDKFTGKTEIRDLEGQVAELKAQLQEKDQEQQKVNAKANSLGFSINEFAIVGISAVAIVAIIAIIVILMKSQPLVIQA